MISHGIKFILHCCILTDLNNNKLSPQQTQELKFKEYYSLSIFLLKNLFVW